MNQYLTARPKNTPKFVIICLFSPLYTNTSTIDRAINLTNRNYFLVATTNSRGYRNMTFPSASLG